MGKLIIEPTENRDVHLKVYVEKSVHDAVKTYGLRHGKYSLSESARELIIQALENEA